MSKLIKMCMGMMLMGVASMATAAITIDQPFTGSSVSVVGKGAPSNAPVELWVNGESRGSVTADTLGRFEFTNQSIDVGDSLEAIVARVWNFNEDDNDEGWSATNFATDGLTTSVQNGIFTATFDSAGELTFGTGGPDLLPEPGLTRVVEMRYRLTSTQTSPGAQTVQYTQVGPDGVFDSGDDVATFGPGFNLAPSPEFVTTQVDISTNLAGNPSPWVNGEDVVFLAFGTFGFNEGDTFEVDYVRVTECFLWEFNNDNDTMLWATNEFVGNEAVLSVAGGNLTATTALDSASTTNSSLGAPAIGLPFNWFDTDHFRVWESRYAVNGPGQPQFEQLEWIDNNGADFYGVNGNRMTRLFTDDGVTTVSVIDLPTHTNFDGSTPTWGEDPTSIALIYYPFLNSDAAGETAVIDYLRLCPQNAAGVSEATIVTGDGPVNRARSWMIFE